MSLKAVSSVERDIRFVMPRPLSKSKLPRKVAGTVIKCIRQRDKRNLRVGRNLPRNALISFTP